jgi:uncharacterized membrane protein YhdT
MYAYALQVLNIIILYVHAGINDDVKGLMTGTYIYPHTCMPIQVYFINYTYAIIHQYKPSLFDKNA